MATKYEYHPLANIFPRLSDDELQKLAADIKANGLEDLIVLYEGKILDGRNRDKACEIAGIDIRLHVTEENFNGDDEALAFVLSKNLHRRHLTESQRAMVAANIANMRQGERTDLQPSAPVHKVSRKTAAAALNVSERSVASAAAVREHGTDELVAAVEAGDIPVKTAAELAKKPVEQQREVFKDLPRDDNGKLTKEAKQKVKEKVEQKATVNVEKMIEAAVAANKDKRIDKLVHENDTLKAANAMLRAEPGHAPKQSIHHDHFCSFCGKASTEVTALVAGPHSMICDECVTLCAEIIEKQKAEKAEVSLPATLGVG